MATTTFTSENSDRDAMCIELQTDSQGVTRVVCVIGSNVCGMENIVTSEDVDEMILKFLVHILHWMSDYMSNLEKRKEAELEQGI